MKITVLQIVTPAIKEYSELTIPIVSKYCIKHNYTHLVFNKDNDYLPHPSWAKIERLLNLNNRFDFVWILDADCIINIDLPIEQVVTLDLDDEYDAYISKNGNNGGRLLNGGSMIFKNKSLDKLKKLYYQYLSSYSIEFLKQAFWEQNFINDCYDNKTLNIDVLEMNVINSWWYKMNDDNFIHHYMVRTINEKIDLITKYLKEKELN